jgi:hypothetical protein
VLLGAPAALEELFECAWPTPVQIRPCIPFENLRGKIGFVCPLAKMVCPVQSYDFPENDTERINIARGVVWLSKPDLYQGEIKLEHLQFMAFINNGQP